MKMTIKIFLIFLSLSLLIIQPASSYAYWHEHRHDYVSFNFGVWPDSYYYPYTDPYYYPYPAPYYYPYTDPYYYPGYKVVAPSSYQSVVAPSNYQPVVVNGATYYLNNGVYYIYTQYGYQAVATPGGVTVPVVQSATVTAASAASTAPDDSFTINIPNNKGGFTAVVLKKSGNGFIGPQGEFYSEFPKVSQLQVVYGK